jgi:hypothetical protein
MTIKGEPDPSELSECEAGRVMHIEITKDKVKGFRVRLVDADGRTFRMSTRSTIESARKAADTWSGDYGNCPVEDKSGMAYRE